MKTSNKPARRPVPLAAALLMLALGAPAVQAVPVSMTLEELPPGLTLTALVSRSSCSNGQVGSQIAGTFPLVESSHVVFDSVTLPFGGTMIRSRVVTTYSGQAANISAAVPPAQRCSFGEALTFTAGVMGANANGTPSQRVLATLGSVANPTTAQNLVARIQGSSSGLPAARDLSRNQLVTFTIDHRNPFGAGLTQLPVMEFSRPGGTLAGGLQLAVTTRLFINEAGARCIRAGGTTKCSNNTPLQNGRLVHGGVELVVSNTRHNDIRSTFQFELNNDFVPATYSVKAFADDNDLIDYLVDGVATSMDLIKWVPTVSTMTVL